MNICGYNLLWSGLNVLLLIFSISLKAVIAPWTGQPPLQMNFKGEHQFFAACREGRADVVQHYLSQSDFDPNQMFKSGRSESRATGFFIACESGHVELVKMLLNVPDIDINKGRSLDGATPLLKACIAGDIELVDLLLECGANPMLGCQASNIEIIDEYLRRDSKFIILFQAAYDPFYEYNESSYRAAIRNPFELNTYRRFIDPYLVAVNKARKARRIGDEETAKKYSHITWKIKQAIANRKKQSPEIKLKEWREKNGSKIVEESKLAEETVEESEYNSDSSTLLSPPRTNARKNM